MVNLKKRAGYSYIHCMLFLLQEVLTVYEIARTQFPNARFNASTFEAFVSELMPFQSSLPVFTQEMGDVWIQGAGSDPLKTALTRAQYRVRTKCIKEGTCVCIWNINV